MAERIKILIADDSAYMRVVLKDMIGSEEGMEVVGTAKDGVEAAEKAKALKPDIVLLDIQMPKMDGLATLQRIMKERPTRVIMLSAMDKVDPDLPLKAFEMGAIEFISKPGGPISVDIVKYRSDIARTIRDVSGAKVDVLKRTMEPLKGEGKTIAPVERPVTQGAKAIVIAASTGGPRALEYIFSRLPRNISASVFVIQHLPAEFSHSFCKRLNSVRGPSIVVAEDSLEAVKGRAYLAPGGFHLTVHRCTESSPLLKLDKSKPIQFVRPSADVLFESAANCYGPRLLAVVLTGMGMDGANGAEAVRSFGGRVVVQDERTSVIFGMPKAVVDKGAADKVVPLEAIPDEIARFLEE